MLATDPAVQMILRTGLSLLLFWAACHKLRDVAMFRSAVASYALLPPRWVAPCAVGLIVTELGVALALCLPALGPPAGLAAAALFAVYAAAIVINLRRGRRDIDCGCGGATGDRPLSGALVFRNGVLVAVAGMSALPATGRPLAWLDAVTIVGGVATLVLLYAGIDALLANAPKLAPLINGRLLQPPSGAPHA